PTCSTCTCARAISRTTFSRAGGPTRASSNRSSTRTNSLRGSARSRRTICSLSINLQRCGIEGAFVLTPSAIGDERGYFKEIYVRSKFQALGIADEFIQDNISVSRQFVLRGLHGDRAMSKLVQVLSGEAFDVIADARPGSPTFGKWEAFALSADNHREIFVPAGCLHGFQALTD